jgi:catechol 2,3-dioxygenase-like lactoylglutathione lyase family enzyme
VIDHVSLNVADLAASRAFYERALAPLGYEQAIEHGAQVGFVSPDRYPDFWIARRDPVGGATHVAFRTTERAKVDAFHAAALSAGAADNGAPGIRHEYGDDYYGAYVLDPDGNNVEAMTYSE